MNIELPLEVWASLLGFLSRIYLGDIVPRVGNRQFVAIVKFYLHKYGAVKLGELKIEYQRGERDGVVLLGRRDRGPPVPLDALPANEMPENIKDFDRLGLSHFDTHLVLPWLKKFADRHLFRNVALHFLYSKQRHILRPLLPLIESIESVRIFDQYSMEDICKKDEKQQQQSGGRNRLATPSWLARARILDICIVDDPNVTPEHTDRFCRWLYTAKPHPNGPFLISFCQNTYAQCLLKRFEKDFLDAAEPISYFTRFRFCLTLRVAIEAKTIQNARTKETFSVKNANNGRSDVLISRLPDQANPGWIEEKEKEVWEWDFEKQSRRIALNEEPHY